jgi:hypothetical protein
MYLSLRLPQLRLPQLRSAQSNKHHSLENELQCLSWCKLGKSDVSKVSMLGWGTRCLTSSQKACETHPCGESQRTSEGCRNCASLEYGYRALTHRSRIVRTLHIWLDRLVNLTSTSGPQKLNFSFFQCGENYISFNSFGDSRQDFKYESLKLMATYCFRANLFSGFWHCNRCARVLIR